MNFFESLHTRTRFSLIPGLIPAPNKGGAKLALCSLIGCFSLAALTGIFYSLGAEYFLAMLLASPISVCTAVALPIIAKVTRLVFAVMNLAIEPATDCTWLRNPRIRTASGSLS